MNYWPLFAFIMFAGVLGFMLLGSVRSEIEFHGGKITTSGYVFAAVVVGAIFCCGMVTQKYLYLVEPARTFWRCPRHLSGSSS